MKNVQTFRQDLRQKLSGNEKVCADDSYRDRNQLSSNYLQGEEKLFLRTILSLHESVNAALKRFNALKIPVYHAIKKYKVCFETMEKQHRPSCCMRILFQL